MTRSLYRRLAPICLIAVIVGSFLPYKMKRDLGTSVVFPSGAVPEQVPLRHRLGHYLSFGVTAAVLILAAKDKSQRVLALLTVGGVSLGIEAAQSLVGRIGIEWWDVRDDTASAIVMFSVLSWQRVRQWLVSDESSSGH